MGATLAPMPCSPVGHGTVDLIRLTNILCFLAATYLIPVRLTTHTRIYDIASNTWSTGAPMPDVRALSAGGYISAHRPDLYCQWHLHESHQHRWAKHMGSTIRWRTVGPISLPALRFRIQPVALPMVLSITSLLAGGRDTNDGLINLTWEYDPTTNTYTQKADEPCSFQNNVPGSAVATGRLWVFGGGNPSMQRLSHYVFRPPPSACLSDPISTSPRST